MSVLIMFIWSIPRNLVHTLSSHTRLTSLLHLLVHLMLKDLVWRKYLILWKKHVFFAYTLDNLALNNKIPSVKRKTKGLQKTYTTLCILFLDLVNVWIDYICILYLTSYFTIFLFILTNLELAWFILIHAITQSIGLRVLLDYSHPLCLLDWTPFYLFQILSYLISQNQWYILLLPPQLKCFHFFSLDSVILKFILK